MRLKLVQPTGACIDRLSCPPDVSQSMDNSHSIACAGGSSCGPWALRSRVWSQRATPSGTAVPGTRRAPARGRRQRRPQQGRQAACKAAARAGGRAARGTRRQGKARARGLRPRREPRPRSRRRVGPGHSRSRGGGVCGSGVVGLTSGGAPGWGRSCRPARPHGGSRRPALPGLEAHCCATRCLSWPPKQLPASQPWDARRGVRSA